MIGTSRTQEEYQLAVICSWLRVKDAGELFMLKYHGDVTTTSMRTAAHLYYARLLVPSARSFMAGNCTDSHKNKDADAAHDAVYDGSILDYEIIRHLAVFWLEANLFGDVLVPR